MHIETFYKITGKDNLKEFLRDKVESDFIDLLMDQTIIKNDEGGRSAWGSIEHTMRVKLLFLADIMSYSTLDSDEKFYKIFGTSKISCELFDMWWEAERFEVEDDAERIEDESKEKLNNIDTTGNNVVDSWIKKLK